MVCVHSCYSKSMETWFLLTLCGAFLQNLRSLLQRKITDNLSINGASFVRFLFAIPFALLICLFSVDSFSGVSEQFFSYVVLAGIAQIVGTSCLISAVVRGNFSVGTTLSKTEAAQAALFGLVVLGDGVSISIALGISVSLLGVIFLSANVDELLSRLSRRALVLGLVSGTGFAIAAVCFRGASLSIDGGTFFERAAITVLSAVTFQSIIMGVYLIVREPGELGNVFENWKMSSVIGGVGMFASLCWFSAMTLNSAAIVRAVGQVELLFTLATTIFWFKEKMRLLQLVGMCLIVGGIWLLV